MVFEYVKNMISVFEYKISFFNTLFNQKLEKEQVSNYLFSIGVSQNKIDGFISIMS